MYPSNRVFPRSKRSGVKYFFTNGNGMYITAGAAIVGVLLLVFAAEAGVVWLFGSVFYDSWVAPYFHWPILPFKVMLGLFMLVSLAIALLNGLFKGGKK